MNAERNRAPRANLPRNHRLEDFGFGSTLAGIAHFTWPRSHSRTSMSMICRALSSQNNWPSVFSW